MSDAPLRTLGLEPLVQFRAIARNRSLRLAASELHLSAPALTRALQRLERGLGAPLCTRGRSGFALTEQGRRLLGLTERLLGDTREFLGEDEPRASLLGVGVLDSGALARIRPALLATLQRFRGTRLNLTLASSDVIDRLVTVGELDVGVSVFDRRRERLRYVRLASEPFRYFIARTHPLWSKRGAITRADLRGQRVVWVDHQRVPAAELAQRVFRRDPRQLMEVVAFTNGLEGALAFLLAGVAVVPMPTGFMQPYLEQRRVKQLALRPRVNQLTTEVVYDPAVPLRPEAEFLLRELGALG